MSSGKTEGMSAQAAADKASTSSLQSGSAPTTAAAAAATSTGAGLQLPAQRVSSTTALLAGLGPTSCPLAPTLAATKADILLHAAAAALDEVQEPSAGQQAAAGTADEGVGSSNSVAPPVNRSHSNRAKKKLIPLRKVLRHSYEYHGLNELLWLCITAVAVNVVLYWHWGRFTAVFKASVQQSFQSYGNPDWQTQSMHQVETMNDAVQYSMGWLEFWLQRAENIDLPDSVVRAQDYGDIQYARVLVNLDRNCDPKFSPHLSCYRNDPGYQQMWHGYPPYGPYNLTEMGHARNQYPCKGDPGHRCPQNPDDHTVGYANLLEWAGWVNVFQLYNRPSLDVPKDNSWWAYTVIAPRYYGQKATRDNYIGRLYNITRQTSLNINNCDWLAKDCKVQPNPCDNVPFADWFRDTAMCPVGNNTVDEPRGPGVRRGNRFFVRDPTGGVTGTKPQGPGDGGILDLIAYLSKYAYSIGIDVMAANTLGDNGKGSAYSSDRDWALFTLMFQRSATAQDKPTRVMWQISSTLPIRTSLYVYRTDFARIYFEGLLLICLAVVLFFQVQQFCICRIQFRSWRPFIIHCWNDYEIISTLLLIIWIVYYVGLCSVLAFDSQQWNMDAWDMVTTKTVNPHWELERRTTWSNAYLAWLYTGIVVDALIIVRVTRYTRVHVGLKAFYQVFNIAGRELMDFAVFCLFILVLLGSAMFAFFQITGGNSQFLRYADGLAVMARLSFGLMDYEEFQAQALGVGAAVSALTFLFWLAVILVPVVYTQNIALAIVAEAYDEAKAKLGTRDTAFLTLVIMRTVFFILSILYRAKLLCGDLSASLHRLCIGKRQLVPSQQARTQSDPSYPADGGMGNSPGHGPQGDVNDGDMNSSSDGATNNPQPPANAFQADAAAQQDQDQTGDNLCAADRHPQAPSVSVLPKDLEMGPEPISLGMAPRSRSSRRLFWYQELLTGPMESGDGWIAAWMRRYWAPWCIARTKAMKSLMSIYQDFTSYKLKKDCTWPQAPEIYQRISVANGAPESSPIGAAADAANLRRVRAAPDFPRLTEESYVDEVTLERLLEVTSEMSNEVPMWFSPFSNLKGESLSYLVQNIVEVYGVDEDDVAAVLEQDRLGSAQGSVINGGGSGDIRLGQVASRHGFLAHLTVKKRERGAETKQVTELMHAQRRLEQLALQTDHDLQSHRYYTKELAKNITDQIKEQQAEQAMVLKVKAQLATMQGGSTSQQQGPASSSATPPIAASTAPKGSTLRPRKAVLSDKHSGSTVSRAGADILAVGPPPLGDTGLDAVVDEASGSAFPAATASASKSSSSSASSGGSGPSRASSNAAQFGGVLAALQLQIEQQQQTLNEMDARQRQVLNALNALLQKQGQHE